jgi:hypothetical protein
LEDFGSFTPDGMTKLRKGGSPTITLGERAGDTIALDHVLPRSIVLELAARFYNLEAVPSKTNLAKSSSGNWILLADGTRTDCFRMKD